MIYLQRKGFFNEYVRVW